MNRKSVAVVGALFLLAGSAAACGDDDDSGAAAGRSDQPQPLAIEATGSGAGVKLAAPAEAEAGLLEVTFSNAATSGEHNAALVKVDSDKPLDEVLKAGNAWGDQGKPLPEWISFYGGAGVVERGEKATVVGNFPAGRYMVLDFNDQGDDGGEEITTELKLTGGGSTAALPKADAAVTSREYGFDAKNLRQGRNQVLWANAGKEPHHMVAAPMKPGKGKADILKAFNDENAAAPFDESQAVEAPLISGGGSQVIALDLKKKGQWALLCFIPDRAGGPPHVAKGMVDIVDVQ